MGSYETIAFEMEGRIARLTLNRPEKLNALNAKMLEEILEALRRVRGSDASVLVLAANGRAFCAGVDLHTPFFMEAVESTSAFVGKDLLDWQHEMIQELYELPQVTLCAVGGDAVGGAGFGMAMACDMRFASPAARFWLIPIKVNVVQDFGVTWFLQRCIGQPRTMQLLMTGAPVSAEKAERWGIVNEVLPAERLLAETLRVAETVATSGHHAALMSKQVVRHGAQVDLRMELHHEAVANGLCFHSTEFRERQQEYRQRALRRGRG